MFAKVGISLKRFSPKLTFTRACLQKQTVKSRSDKGQGCATAAVRRVVSDLSPERHPSFDSLGATHPEKTVVSGINKVFIATRRNPQRRRGWGEDKTYLRSDP